MANEIVQVFIGSTTPLLIEVDKDTLIDGADDIRVSFSTTDDETGVFFSKASLTSSSNEILVTPTQEEADAFVEGLHFIELAIQEGSKWKHTRELVRIKKAIITHD